jgi:protein-S-isoprenylcysteine O-methyltransferase Ste14
MTMSDTPLSSTLPDHDLLDFGVRAALGLAFAFYAGVCFNRAVAQFATVDFSRLDAHSLSQALSALAIGLYALTVACLYALRLRPIRKASGAWPRAAALLGAFLMFGLLMLDQRTDLPLAAQAAASILILAGNGIAIFVLAHLGRSFSILPESRRLVTSGPYQVVRHPLYLAEAVATLGVFIEFLSPWALLLFAMQISMQIVRIHYEENVLRETFPEYAIYAQHSWRLIPMIY